jgi:hypothetical protein
MINVDYCLIHTLNFYWSLHASTHDFIEETIDQTIKMINYDIEVTYFLHEVGFVAMKYIESMCRFKSTSIQTSWIYKIIKLPLKSIPIFPNRFKHRLQQ